MAESPRAFRGLDLRADSSGYDSDARIHRYGNVLPEHVPDFGRLSSSKHGAHVGSVTLGMGDLERCAYSAPSTVTGSHLLRDDPRLSGTYDDLEIGQSLLRDDPRFNGSYNEFRRDLEYGDGGCTAKDTHLTDYSLPHTGNLSGRGFPAGMRDRHRAGGYRTPCGDREFPLPEGCDTGKTGRSIPTRTAPYP